MYTILVIAISLLVGFMVGTTGIGGILLPPVLEILVGIDTHTAMGTALFSFIFYTPLSSFMYWRAGQLDWRATIPLCIGAFIFSYVGATLKAQLPATILIILLALLIIWAGVLVFFPMRSGGLSVFIRLPQTLQNIGLFGVGAIVGMVAGLTGAGGPVLSIPIMILLGFAPVISIAVGQVLTFSAAIMGSIGNYIHGALDIELGIFIGLVQLVAVIVGVKVARLFNPERLRRLIGLVCIVVGLYLLIDSTIRMLA